MGNDGEVFRTSEGALYQVVASYEYLYAYYPEVTICPDRRRMMVEDKVIGIVPVQPAPRQGGVPAKTTETHLDLLQERAARQTESSSECVVVTTSLRMDLADITCLNGMEDMIRAGGMGYSAT